MRNYAINISDISKKYLINSNKDKTTIDNSFKNLLHETYQKIFDYQNWGKSTNKRQEFWALKNINLQIKAGEKIGIIGKNGAGKSTLLKILSRITSPSSGYIEINGKVSSLLEVGTGFHDELTGRENIFLNGSILGMSRREVINRFDEIVDFAGIEKFIDTPVKRFSSGMKTRLGFAIAANLRNDILILDEVLAVGDAEFQAKSLKKMDSVSKSEGKTIIFVSHNMGAVQQLCSNAALLDKGTIIDYGDVASVSAKYLKIGIQGGTYRKNEGIDFIEVKNKKEFISSFPYKRSSVTLCFKNISASTFDQMSFSLSIMNQKNERVVNLCSYEIIDNFDIPCGYFEITVESDPITLSPGIYKFDIGFYNKFNVSSLIAVSIFEFEITKQSFVDHNFRLYKTLITEPILLPKFTMEIKKNGI